MFAKNSRGFTLVELMVTLAIGAVVALWAVPNFREVILKNRLKSTVTDLQASIMNARSEAVQRSIPVVIKPLVGSDWASGWTIQTAATGIPVTTINTRPASEDAVNQTITVDTSAISGFADPSNGASQVRYGAAGFAQSASGGGFTNGCLTFKSTSTDTTNRRLSLILNVTGRPYICNPDATVGTKDYKPNCCTNTSS
jgi:type IV fimbrial biogenesis protein FimT